jgi:hypothetical protein
VLLISSGADEEAVLLALPVGQGVVGLAEAQAQSALAEVMSATPVSAPQLAITHDCARDEIVD